jgi:DNA modification methylase
VPIFPSLPQSHNGILKKLSATSFVKEPSLLEQKAYRDTWGRGLDSYLEWFYETVVQARELLAEDGSMYVHLDWHIVHYAKAILDEVFGYSNFLSEIIWRRKGGSALGTMRRMSTATDTILLYAKGEDYKFNTVYEMPSDEYIEQNFSKVDEKGRRFQATVMRSPSPRPNLMYDYKGYKMPPNGWSVPLGTMKELDKKGMLYFPGDKSKQIYKKIYLDEYIGQPVNNLWDDIPTLKGKNAEIVNYPTQKPEALLTRILKISSDEGDLVLDCFAGSGTTAVVAEKMNRRWMACDLSRFAIHTTRKRLLSITNVKPFSVLNLGRYERQVWQAAEFRIGGHDELEQQRQREAAYRKFILDLYHANPTTGLTWLHGAKAGRMVHVGAVDAPVTIADVKSIAREVWKTGGNGGARRAAADILGWEFAFELNETARQVAAESRVDVSFKKIPREVLDKRAVEQGDVKFFELGALSVEPKQKGRELTLKLTDFVIPVDDIPEDARHAIKHWSQMIDYWAVDWDFKNDTFHNQWQSYRTRKDTKIELSAKSEYAGGGTYKVVVKVIDILGNDTTKTLEVKVR